MTRGYVLGLGFLAAVWGASYLFIKVAVEDGIEPAPLVFVRTAVAGLLLLPFVLARRGGARGLGELRATWRVGLVLGLLNAAVPYTLIAWGEKHVDSGVAAIANATVPLFVLLLALRFQPTERPDRGRLAGVLLGLVGVGILAGAQPDGGWWAVAGTLAVVVASFSYAVSQLVGARQAAGTPGEVLATGSMLGAALLLVPAALLQAPDHAPGWQGVGSIAALTVLGTAAAQLVLFRMLRLYGSSRTALVTYLLPPTALVYGVLFLNEPLSVAALVGLALILPGVALGSGAVRLPRRRTIVSTP